MDGLDDFSGSQLHVYHAVPSNARGSRDKIGDIGAVVQAAQRWLAVRTYQGRVFRLDIYQGRPDVTTLPLTVPTAEMQVAPGGAPSSPRLSRPAEDPSKVSDRDLNKLHVAFLDAPPFEEGGFCDLAVP